MLKLFKNTRFFVWFVTVVTLALTYFVAGQRFSFILNCIVAALVVAVLIGLARVYVRAFRHHDAKRVRFLLVVSVAAAVGLTATFTETNFGSTLGHLLVGFTSWSGWFATAILVIGSYVAIVGFKRRPAMTASSNNSHRAHDPQASNFDLLPHEQDNFPTSI